MKKTREEIQENQEIEIRLLIEALYLKYGYDFRNYSKGHIKRRILNRFQISEVNSITEMTHKANYDNDFMDKILMDLSITVTEMFRDPSFYKALRQIILRHAKKAEYPISRIKEFTVNYQKAGIKRYFSDYYKADNETAKLNENLQFSPHFLAFEPVVEQERIYIKEYSS